MAYDVVGRLIAVTNADGFVTTNAYDLNDNLIATADGLGNVWQYTYDSAGRKLTETDPLNNTTYFYYNGDGDLIQRYDALGNSTYYGYDGEGRLTAIEDANGNIKRMTYDAAGRLTSTRLPFGNTNGFYYDAVGNLVATVDSLGITNQISTYDVRNQPVAIQDALGNTKRLSYDALQRLIQTVDALNRTNSLAYDALSHLTTGINPLSLVSRQQFDSDGNRTNIINPKTAFTTFAYDLAERLTNTATATGKQTGYALDGRNLITKITQPSGAQTTNTYDAAGRLIQCQDSVGTISYTYDNKGRLLTVTENGKTITRQYNALDRLTQYTDAAGNVLKYGYDNVGNLTSLTYPDGKVVTYSYGVNNWLNYVSDWNGFVTYYYYDADGRVIKISHPDGSTTTRAYDAAGRLVQQADVTSASSNIYSVNFAYDAANQIIGETNLPVAADYQPAAVTMNYNADNALTNYGGQAVTLDADGDMTSGPLTNATFATYTYNARNRLTGVGGTTYTYDPADNRVASTNGGVVTRFVVNPNVALSQVLMRVKIGMTNYYVYGLDLLYEVAITNGTSKVLTHHYDYRGSTVALTDGSGNVTDRISYSPYGSIITRTGTNDTPFLFAGKNGVLSDNNGLLYMRARYYNPFISRFVSQDVLVGDITTLISLNRYAYAANSPIILVDPTGRDYVDIQVFGGDILGGYLDIQLPLSGGSPVVEVGPGVAEGFGGSLSISTGQPSASGQGIVATIASGPVSAQVSQIWQPGNSPSSGVFSGQGQIGEGPFSAGATVSRGSSGNFTGSLQASFGGVRGGAGGGVFYVETPNEWLAQAQTAVGAFWMSMFPDWEPPLPQGITTTQRPYDETITPPPLYPWNGNFSTGNLK